MLVVVMLLLLLLLGNMSGSTSDRTGVSGGFGCAVVEVGVPCRCN